MAPTVVKLTRVITQTKDFEIDLPGDNEEMIDESLSEHVRKKAADYHNVEDLSWDLEEIEITDEEVVEYPEFDEEE